MVRVNLYAYKFVDFNACLTARDKTNQVQKESVCYAEILSQFLEQLNLLTDPKASVKSKHRFGVIKHRNLLNA